MSNTLRAPLQMPTLRIELEGIKQAMAVALTASQEELIAAIRDQLTQCLATLTPEEILLSVRRAFEQELHAAVSELAPQFTRDAVHVYFTTGPGAKIVREALAAQFKL